MFLMPSHYESGGLDQLCCRRYGAVPVVQATGGLDANIQEYNPKIAKMIGGGEPGTGSFQQSAIS